MTVSSLLQAGIDLRKDEVYRKVGYTPPDTNDEVFQGVMAQLQAAEGEEGAAPQDGEEEEGEEDAEDDEDASEESPSLTTGGSGSASGKSGKAAPGGTSAAGARAPNKVKRRIAMRGPFGQFYGSKNL